MPLDPYANAAIPTQTPPPAAAPPGGGGDPYANAALPTQPAADPYADPPPASTAPTHWYDQLKQAAQEAIQGATSSFAQVPATAMRAIQRTPAVGPALSKYTDLDSAERDYAAAAAKTPDTIAGKTGGALWTMAEWMAGGEVAGAAAEGLKGSQYLAKVASNMKLLENSPRLAEAVRAHPEIAALLKTGAAQGAGTAAQTLAHGGSLKDATEAGLVGAGVGGVLHGIGAAFPGAQASVAERAAAVAPDTVEVAGEQVPRYAAQRPGVNDADAAIVTQATNPEIQAAQQAKAQAAFGNVATRAAQNGLDRFGAVATPAEDFGQAARQLEDKAGSLYDEFDRATEGRFRQYNADIQKAKSFVNQASTGAQMSAAQAQLEAEESKMKDLFDGFDDANYSEALKSTAQKAKATFNDQYALDDIHNTLNKAFNIPSSATAAEAAIPGDVGPARTLNVPGQRRADLADSLAKIEDKYGRDRLTSLLGADGLGNLHKIAKVTDNPVQNEAAMSLAREVLNSTYKGGATGASVGGLLGHFSGLGWGRGAAIGGTVGIAKGASEVAARRFLYSAAMSPRIGNLLSFAARNGTSVKYAAPLIQAAIYREMREQNQPPPAQGDQQ
jgi:hypothetical protein